MDPKCGSDRPPSFGGPTSAFFHCNRQLDEERQKFMRTVQNQTINRRSSTGLIGPNSTFSKTFGVGTRFRRLHKLHYESLGVGLNDTTTNCIPNVYSYNRSHGLLFRASLPATPISTPIHKDFQPFTEQLLFDRLCRTPSPARRVIRWDANNNQVNRDPRLDGRIGRASLNGSMNSLNKSINKMSIEESMQESINRSNTSIADQFDVDELSESDIGTMKGLKLALQLNRAPK